MAALRMRVTRDRRSAMLRSRLAAGRARVRLHPASCIQHASQSRLHAPARARRKGQGQYRWLREPPPQPGLRTAADLGKEPSPAPQWICCFCSSSIFPVSPSLLTHTLGVSPSYFKGGIQADGVYTGTSTRTHHHHPTKK